MSPVLTYVSLERRNPLRKPVFVKNATRTRAPDSSIGDSSVLPPPIPPSLRRIHESCRFLDKRIDSSTRAAPPCAVLEVEEYLADRSLFPRGKGGTFVFRSSPLREGTSGISHQWRKEGEEDFRGGD